MANINRTETVHKGDSPWKIAARSLKNKGVKVTNADIIKEMNRLTILNGCTDVDDFGKKFFSSIGKQVITEKKAATPKQKAIPQTKKTSKTKIVHKKIKQVKVPVESTKLTYNAKINSMANDTQRIVEYNKTNYQGQYYGIVDKKSCQLKIYNKEGKVVQTFEVGVGKTKGDGISQNYLDVAEHTTDAWKAESKRYTTAGEFTLDEVAKGARNYTSQGIPKIMSLKGDNYGVRGGQMSIHMIPNHRPERKAKFGDGNADNNRMSYGCVNLREEDYDAMHKLLGEGDKIYVLPEENGNKLQLNRQKDGTYKFEQVYHKKDSRGKTKEQASAVKYDMKPDRNPKVIAQKEHAKNLEKQKQLAQQETELSWYNPRKWLS
ncbi:L,D-transpeptidase [bacterium]|nr:L,D-transpeptidase [bacterium]